jgi:hypothetical protein
MLPFINLKANITLTVTQYCLIRDFNFDEAELKIIWLGIAIQQGLSAKEIIYAEHITDKTYKLTYNRVSTL